MPEACAAIEEQRNFYRRVQDEVATFIKTFPLSQPGYTEEAK